MKNKQTNNPENSLISILRRMRMRWFPSTVQREMIQQEKQALQARKALYGSFLQRGDLCFDIGANMGNRIRPLLEIGIRVVAVEPQESCQKQLSKTFGNSITLVPKGVGAQKGVQNFHISDSHTLSSFSSDWISAVKEERFKEYNWDKVVEMEMTTLDQLIAEHGKPSFIKIDVEGYETEVLKGLSIPINMISFEYTVPEQTEKVIECLELIEKNGSRVTCNYSIGESMLLELSDWLTIEEMKTYVSHSVFIATGFGDIYVRQSDY